VHELGLVAEIVELLVARSEGARVTKVVLEIGKLTAVLPDAVRFCWDVVAEGTVVSGATLEIIEKPGVGRCLQCSGRVEMARPFGRCDCGSSELDWIEGHELRVKEMEMA
jgi:hydrogenase nickel incorporation protein HypA/HybF